MRLATYLIALGCLGALLLPLAGCKRGAAAYRPTKHGPAITMPTPSTPPKPLKSPEVPPVISEGKGTPRNMGK